MTQKIYSLMTEKGALVNPSVEPIMLLSHVEKLNGFLKDPQGLSSDDVEKLQNCVNILNGFVKTKVYTQQTPNKKWTEVQVVSAIVSLGDVGRYRAPENYNVQSKEDFDFDKVFVLLENKRLLKKVLKFLGEECVIFNALQKSKMDVKKAIIDNSKEITDDIEEHKNVGYVVFIDSSDGKNYLDKTGYRVKLTEARLYKDVASANRSARAQRHTSFSVLKVNLMVAGLEMENNVVASQERDKVLAKSSKENLLKELDKNDVELLRKRLAELEEKYDEKPSASVERKRKM